MSQSSDETSSEPPPSPRPRDASETRVRRSRIALALVFVAGLLVFSYAVSAPFWLDDYAQIAMVEGNYPGPRGPIDLYDFVRETERDMLVDRGLLPWWTNPRYKLRFFRPLSSSLLWAEYRLTHHNALAMHLISFAWWAAAIVVLRALFRRLFSERVAWIGIVIFALAPCHALPLAWIANREVLVSLTLGSVGLLALSRLANGSLGSALLATLFFSLALAGGEYGMCFGGYVLAFALCRGDLGWQKRIGAFASFAVPAAVYLALRSALKYGTAGSGFYHDPLRVPLVFLSGAPRRFATLMVDTWTTIDFDEFGANVPWWILALIVCVCVLIVFRPIRATLAAQQDVPRRDARWLLFGSMLSLVPLLAVAASARLIAVSLLGVVAIIALVIDRAWYSSDKVDHTTVMQHVRVVAAVLTFFHFVHGPTWAFLLTRGQHLAADDFALRAAWLRERVGDTSHANVIVARAGWGSVLFAPLAIDARGRPPAMWRTLVPSQHALILRLDARTIDLVIPHGAGFFPVTPNDLFRDPDVPLHAGDEVAISGMRATVIDMGEVGPARLRFVFDRDLDDPSLTWVIEVYSGYRDSPPPAVGFGGQLDVAQ